MFERFTERARQVVVLAQEEARTLKHNYIGTEHILLGLLREEEGLAARVLESLDGDVEGLEDARGQPLLLAEQTEQDVLGADVIVLERAGFLLGQDDHLAGPLCESLEHGGGKNLPAGMVL